MSTRRRFVVLVAWLALGGAAHAGSFEGQVVRVIDGDSFVLKPRGSRDTLEVRIRGIDAPELCQPHGREARDALASRLLRQRVRVQTAGRDDYDRVIGKVLFGSEDIAGYLVVHGHAWAQRWRGRPVAYAAQEAEAREERRGLWTNADAIQPRDFRRQNGRCGEGRRLATIAR